MNGNIPLETYRRSDEFERIGRRAVREVQEDNRRRGIPNVYSINGVIYYELPNGEMTRENPFTDTHPAT